MLPIEICVRCEHMIGVVNGRFTCGKSNLPIIQHRDSGKCPEGKFEAQASVQVGGIVHGAKGIAKAITGTGGASKELIDQRTAICNGCDHAVKSLGVIERCNLCGCSTWAKIRNAGEKCPAGKW